MSEKIALIDEHIMHGRLEQARSLVNAILSESPSDEDARLADARLLLLDGEVDRAVESLEDLMVDIPGAPTPLMLMAECMLLKNEKSQAIAFARKSLSWGGESAFIHWLLGTDSLEQQDYETALTSFDRALAIHPNLANGWLGKGLTLKALSRLADAEDALIQAVQCAPDQVEIWVALIRLEMDAGVHDIAADNLALALRSHPGHPALIQLKSEEAESFTDEFSMGLDALCQAIYDQDLERMDETMDSMVTSHFDHPRLVIAKGEVCLAVESKLKVDLIHALNRYIRTETQDWWARTVLGRLLLRESALQNLPMAVAHCEDAWRASGEHPHAAIGLVEAWASTGKHVYAKALCEKLAKGNRRESVKARALLEGRIS
jgi:tetratricopeptide (TPR) repeat protein